MEETSRIALNLRSMTWRRRKLRQLSVAGIGFGRISLSKVLFDGVVALIEDVLWDCMYVCYFLSILV